MENYDTISTPPPTLPTTLTTLTGDLLLPPPPLPLPLRLLLLERQSAREPGGMKGWEV